MKTLISVREAATRKLVAELTGAPETRRRRSSSDFDGLVSGPYRFFLRHVHPSPARTERIEPFEMTGMGIERLAEQNLARLAPSRLIPNSYGRENKIGVFYSQKARGHIPYESSLEEDFLLTAEFDRRVAAISAQPFRLDYQVGPDTESTTPDFLLVMRNGEILVREVKPKDKVSRPQVQRALAAGRAAVEPVGWDWDLAEPLPPILRKNLWFLHLHRDEPYDQENWRERLRENTQTPVEVGELLARVHADAVGKAVMLAMLWRQELVAALTRELLDVGALVAVPNHEDHSGALRYVEDTIDLRAVTS